MGAEEPSTFPLNIEGTLSDLTHPHSGQTASASSLRLKISISKIFPHRLHLYSNIGTAYLYQVSLSLLPSDLTQAYRHGGRVSISRDRV
jgi:hypothetical protein